MGPFVRAAGRRALTGCLIKLVTTILVFTCLGAGSLVALILPIPPGADRTMVFMFMMFVSLSAAMLVAFAALGLVMWRRQKESDSTFTPFGLQGSSYVQGGRQYHGAVAGRNIDVYWSLRGPRLVVEVGSSVATRLAVGTSTGLGSALGSVLGLRTIDLSWDPGYAGLVASGHDEAWTRWVLAQPQLRGAVLGMAHQTAPSEVRAVVIAPGKVGLNLHFVSPSVLDPAAIHPMLQQLIQLAATVESMPQPPERLAPSSLELSARSMTNSVSTLRFYALGFAGLTALVIGGVGVAGVVAIMAGAL